MAEIVRFGTAGITITLAAALGYWLLTRFLGIQPNLALLLVFIVMSLIGFWAHLRFSFRKSPADHFHNFGRYFLVNTGGFALNQIFVWLLVQQLAAPLWAPIIPMVMVTPVATYLLLRNWVYRDRRQLKG
jgi:putative flippase GtrA